MPLPYLRNIFSRTVKGNDRPATGHTDPDALASRATGGGADFQPMKCQELLETNATILNKIRLCYGREQQLFEADLMTVVRHYAEFVNALPATADNYFAFRGGLLRQGLETAFYALQATDAQIFEGRATITQRRHLEPRWRHATFIAGLCMELQPALGRIAVMARNGACWPSYMLPLSAWLTRNAAPYHIRWSNSVPLDATRCLYALPHIVPANMMECLADQNAVVVPSMLASVCRLPLSCAPATMTTLTRRAAALAIDKELRRVAAVRGTSMRSDHLAHLLIDIMHDLAHSAAAWVPNSEKARLWHAEDGTFVVWPGAAQDIANFADRERLLGVPRETESMLAALAIAGMIEQGHEGWIWIIRPHGAGHPVECLKLSMPELLLAGRLWNIEPIPPLSAQPEPTTAPDFTPPPPPVRPSNAEPLAARPATESSRQLELKLRPATSPLRRSVSPGSTPDSHPPAVREHLSPTLATCLRLPPDIANVLRAALATLDGKHGEASVHLVTEGVLIPFETFLAADVDSKLATRCLKDAGMLVVGESGNATYTVKMNGHEVRGLVLRRQCVNGLPDKRQPESERNAGSSI